MDTKFQTMYLLALTLLKYGGKIEISKSIIPALDLLNHEINIEDNTDTIVMKLVDRRNN